MTDHDTGGTLNGWDDEANDWTEDDRVTASLAEAIIAADLEALRLNSRGVTYVNGQASWNQSATPPLKWSRDDLARARAVDES